MYKWLTITPGDVQVSKELMAQPKAFVYECCPVAVASKRTFGEKARACSSLILVLDPYTRWIPSKTLNRAILDYDAHAPFRPGRYQITLDNRP